MPFGRGNVDVGDFNVFGGNHIVAHDTIIGDDEGAVDARESGITSLLDHAFLAQFLYQGVSFAVDDDFVSSEAVDTVFQQCIVASGLYNLNGEWFIRIFQVNIIRGYR